MKKKIVFLDMDGVLANFKLGLGRPLVGSLERPNWEQDPPEMYNQYFFRNLPVMAGAKEGVARLLANEGIEVYIASKPTSENLWCASEKFEWIKEHFPALLKRMILVCDKSLLLGDYLIDDDHHTWGHKFNGEFLHFNEDDPLASWKEINEQLEYETVSRECV